MHAVAHPRVDGGAQWHYLGVAVVGVAVLGTAVLGVAVLGIAVLHPLTTNRCDTEKRDAPGLHGIIGEYSQKLQCTR